MMKINKICQSCGMPLKKDPNHGGTDTDGTKNTMYCSYCYVDGNFSCPEIDTAEKMQKMCIEKMQGMKFPKFIAWIFTRTIPKLKRWNQ